ncbi:TPA: oligosaccharide flippase family protein, partial [Vibrio parahaemolyticus]|nr:oligosaccharide flippase family protein [Vibrio parahaemolyticus]
MKSRVYSNTIALVFVQLANYLSPLLVLPFLTRTFGPEGFGELALIFSIMAIFLIFTDYGFNIVSPYKIAKRQSDKNYISMYVSNVILAKLFIYLLCGVALAVLCLFTNVIEVDLDIYLYVLLGVFFQSIQLNWFYQGIEKLKILTLATVFGKVFYLI